MIKNKKFLKEIISTGITQLAVLILGILILKIVSHYLPEEGFGVYLIIRRFISLGYPIITLNLSISIARNANSDSDKAVSFLFAALMILTGFVFLGIVISSLFKVSFSRLLFGSDSYIDLVLPMWLFLFANSVQLLLFGFFRGVQRFELMNISNLLFWIIQLAVLIIYPYTGNHIQYISSFLYFSSAVVLIVYITLFFKYSGLKITSLGLNKKWLSENIDFFKYGIYRIPNGFFLAGIFFIPIFIATQKLSLTHAAYIGVIISVVRILYQTGLPFNMILLPKFSQYKSSENRTQVVTKTKMIVELIFTFPMIFGALCYFFSPEIIQTWFGPQYIIVVDYLKYVLPGVGLLIGYVLLRGILDGLYLKAYTNLITLFGFLVTVLLSLLSALFKVGLLGLSISLAVGTSTLGLFSLLLISRKEKIIVLNHRNIYALIWAAFVYAMVYVLQTYFQTTSNLGFVIITKTLIAIIILCLSYLIYKWIGYSWLKIFVKEKSLLDRSSK
jgi:O-antigen/teichoic acid export membrane protein